MRARIGHHDILFLTLDTLRFDAAQDAWRRDELPVLGPLLGPGGWEERHTPGTFTYPAHCAFFAGFLPTPAEPGDEPRLFALPFPGATTIGRHTALLEGRDIVDGLARQGYRTICIGGVGFFNMLTPLGSDLPGRFQEAHWNPSMGVGDPHSTEHQVALAMRRLSEIPKEQRVFLFINVSAIHQPNHHHLPGAVDDDLETHRAALRYVDGALAPLLEACAARAPTTVLAMGDHGTLYGEDGHWGHRIAHPLVTTVPYTHFVIGGP